MWSSAPKMAESEAVKIWKWFNDGGMEAVVAWLYRRDVSKFNPAATPKTTEFKEQMISQSLSGAESYLVEMVRNRQGVFSKGIIGGPFHAVCDMLAVSAPPGSKIYQQALLHAFSEAGWVSRGMCASGRNPTRKHIYTIPEMQGTKSEFRNMIEERGQGTINNKIRSITG